MTRLWPYVLVLVALATLLAAALVNRIPPDVEVETVPHQLNPSPADAEPTSFAYVVPTTTTSTTSTTAPRRKRAPLPTQERTEAFEAAYAVEVADLIRDGFARFGADVAEQAVRVAACETGGTFDPRATNGVHVGLFQLSGRYHRDRAARLGFTWDRMYEARPNIAVAADLYAEQKWGPWTCQP